MGWDEPPRRPSDARQGSPGASSRWRNPNAQQGSFLGGEAPSPYRPYQSYAGITRMPDVAKAQEMVTSARIQAVQMGHHHGFAFFHDGNAGHLWRGEVTSLFGESILSVGIVMWLAYLTNSVFAVALGVAALGLPWLFAGPIGTKLRDAPEPGARLAWIGRLRILFALGLVPMHFFTIYPVVYGLLFAIAFCGRLREHLRIAATRTCLAPGELERVSNELHVGAAVVAVAGPLLATLFFAIVGERVLLVSIGAAAFFLLSMNSDGFLDALPKDQRAYLLATPEPVDPEKEWETGDLDEFPDDADMDLDVRRELRLPEWYQQGPETGGQAFAELRAGLGLAGGRKSSRWSLTALATLALVGGGLTVLEVFLLSDRLNLPSFYLGPLLAAEGAGLALGALAGGGGRGSGRAAWVFGMVGSGLTLALLILSPFVPLTLVLALLLGLMNAVAVSGARRVLLAGFTSIERRAIAAAEAWLVAFSSVVGALVFAFFYGGTAGLGPLAKFSFSFAGWPLAVLLPGAGLSLALIGIVFGTLAGGGGGESEFEEEQAESPGASLARGRTPRGDDWGDQAGADESAYMPASGGGDWDDEPNYDDRQGPSSRYRSPTNFSRGKDGYYDEDEPDDPRPPRRSSGLAPRRPPSGGGRGLLSR